MVRFQKAIVRFQKVILAELRVFTRFHVFLTAEFFHSKQWSYGDFPLRIFSVIVTKSTENSGFGHIY